MSEHFRKTCPLLAAVALFGSAAAGAWTPYGHGPYGLDHRTAGPPSGSQAPADRGSEADLVPPPGYPSYGTGPGSRFPDGPPYGPEGYGPQPPPYPPYGAGPGFPGTGRSGYGGQFGPLQISRQATDDNYIIEVQLNDMKPEDIQVSTRGNSISVSRDQSRQEVREDSFEQGRGYSRSYSFSSGNVSRRFNVPHDADLSALTRETAEGVLRILIPRRRR